jgi:hypothetical protein
MKLRINHNSLRLRLSRTDVERLMQTGVVEESTLLGGAIPFAYRLLIDRHSREIRTGRYAHGIQVRLPEDVAFHWSSSDRTGISAVETHPGGRETTVIIEKDFSCLKPRQGDGDEDAFPNPAAGDSLQQTPSPTVPSKRIK